MQKIIRKIKNNKRMILIITILLVTVLIIALFYYFKVGKRQETNKHYIMNVTGKVVDLHTNEPIAGIEVRSADKKEVTKKDGLFHFDNIYADSVLTLNGGDFYDDIQIEVNERKEMIIQIDSKLFSQFRDIETYEKYRKYRNIYELLSFDLKNSISEDEYLKQKNSLRDRLVDENNYVDLTLEISRDITKLDDNSIKTTFSYQWKKQNGTIEEHKYFVKFKFENENWKLNDLLLEM